MIIRKGIELVVPSFPLLISQLFN